MNGAMISIPGYMQQVVCHEITPADLILEYFNLWKLSPLATIILVIIIFTFIFNTPFLKLFKFHGIRKYNFKMRFLRYRFQIVIQVMMIFMPVPDNFRCCHMPVSSVDSKKSFH